MLVQDRHVAPGKTSQLSQTSSRLRTCISATFGDPAAPVRYPSRYDALPLSSNGARQRATSRGMYPSIAWDWASSTRMALLSRGLCGSRSMVRACRAMGWYQDYLWSFILESMECMVLPEPGGRSYARQTTWHAKPPIHTRLAATSSSRFIRPTIQHVKVMTGADCVQPDRRTFQSEPA